MEDELSPDITPEEAEAADAFSHLLDPGKDAPASALLPPVDEKATTDAYGWQKARRKPDRGEFFNLPIAGFGPEGRHTLWLPAPRQTSQWKIVEGKARLIETKSCMEDASISALRDEVLMSFRRTAPTIFAVVPTFLNYCAAIITSNYTVTDDDLNFLLADGGPWQDGMARHLIASPDTIARVFDLRVAEPFTPRETSPVPAPVPAPVPVPQPAVAPVGLLAKKRRFLGFFWR